jgi:glycosyltransferase involved in cell wall biosynthesis
VGAVTRLIYIANIRLPTEKAHGLQIVQNCEAFAAAGADVSLWAARRFNTPAMRAIPDVYAHYGVARNFAVRRLPTLDLLPLVPGRTDAPARAIFYTQLLTFALSALIALLFTRADVIYSRDPLVLLAASLVKPKAALAYEAHQLSVGQLGTWLQRTVVRRAGTVVAVTQRLRDDLLAHDPTHPGKFLVAHDGVRAARFADLPTQAAARQRLGWDEGAFIVGYVGRLHTMTQDKGVGTVIEALARVKGASLALVGGPDEMAAAYREQWRALGLPDERFLYAGQVAPGDVPPCMVAFDVCVMPLPFTPHFAYHASPLKLFEYMASGSAVVTTDLPAWADVVQHEHNALLVPPSDVGALSGAFARLRDDPALRARLGETAGADALTHHTWGARAERILAFVTKSARSASSPE